MSNTASAHTRSGLPFAFHFPLTPVPVPTSTFFTNKPQHNSAFAALKASSAYTHTYVNYLHKFLCMINVHEQSGPPPHRFCVRGVVVLCFSIAHQNDMQRSTTTMNESTKDQNLKLAAACFSVVDSKRSQFSAFTFQF